MGDKSVELCCERKVTELLVQKARISGRLDQGTDQISPLCGQVHQNEVAKNGDVLVRLKFFQILLLLKFFIIKKHEFRIRKCVPIQVQTASSFLYLVTLLQTSTRWQKSITSSQKRGGHVTYRQRHKDCLGLLLMNLMSVFKRLKVILDNIICGFCSKVNSTLHRVRMI